MNTARAFTLVELLVASSLTVLVGGAVVATLSGGIRVWQRVQAHGMQDQWIEVAFYQIRRDLRNARRFEPMPFQGTYEAFSVPSPVDVHTEAGVSWQEIGHTGYFLDSRRHTLCRSQLPYRLMRQRRLTDSCQPVMFNVDRVRMSYYRFDPETKTSKWQSSWTVSEPPLAVKMELSYREPGTRERTSKTLLVHLPTAPGPSPERSSERE